MTTATSNLEDDHIFILRLTDVMLAMVDQYSMRSDHFDEVVELIRKFADGLHHAKEEDQLFPLMERKGFSREMGPVAVMLAEHEQGRKYVQGIADGTRALKDGDEGALLKVHENLTAYALLLQNHIGKENNILFRMADQVLSDEEQLELLDRFTNIEAQADTTFGREKAIQRINNLAAFYLQG